MGNSKPNSTVRQGQASPKGMEAIMEVDEDCFSTNKTLAKHEGGFGSSHQNYIGSRGANNLGGKTDVSISDFSRAQEDRDRNLDGGFKVITERTEENDTSRQEQSQTSIKVAKEPMVFSFKKEREGAGSKDRPARHGAPRGPQKSDVVLREGQKTSKKGLSANFSDRGIAGQRFMPGSYPWNEKSVEPRTKLSQKDPATSLASRSRSNCDTERKGEVRVLKDGDWKHKSHSKRFFKSFKDILQRQGFPGSLFSAKTMKAVEAVEAGRAVDGPAHKSFRDRFSPDLGDRSLEFPRKSKSFLKLK